MTQTYTSMIAIIQLSGQCRKFNIKTIFFLFFTHNIFFLARNHTDSNRSFHPLSQWWIFITTSMLSHLIRLNLHHFSSLSSWMMKYKKKSFSLWQSIEIETEFFFLSFLCSEKIWLWDEATGDEKAKAIVSLSYVVVHKFYLTKMKFANWSSRTCIDQWSSLFNKNIMSAN